MVLISPPDGSGVRLDAPRPTPPDKHAHPPTLPTTAPPWLSRTPWDAKRIDQVFTPGGRTGVHVLGSFDRRITFFNQQVRALLSVRAMHDLGRLKVGTRVAVVGGGAAGVTAALAAHLLGADVHLYESESLLFPCQRPADHRLLHPHVYDWPERSMSEDRAGLPLLDWEAGRASDVVAAIDQRFRERFPSSRIHCSRDVVHITSVGGRGFTLDLATGPGDSFDIVLLAVGFGPDGANRSPPVPGDTTPGYWSPSDGLGDCSGRQVVIGGAGDGGLIDAARAAIRGFQHHVTLRKLLDHDEGRRLAHAMLAIDRAAWDEMKRTGARPEDLLNRYMAQLKPSDELLGNFRDQPTNASKVTLVTDTPGLLRLDTALVNRLMVFLLEQVRRLEFRGGEVVARPGGTSFIRLRGGREVEQPGVHLLLRRGPDPTHYLHKLFPEAAKWLVPVDRRVEDLELTRNLDLETWRFWQDLANP